MKRIVDTNDLGILPSENEDGPLYWVPQVKRILQLTLHVHYTIV